MLFRKRHHTDSQTEETPWAESEQRPMAHLEPESAPADWREPDALPSPEEQTDVSLDVDAEGQHPRKRKRGIRIGQFFTGGVLSQEEFTQRLPVLVYIVFLMLLYIANGFHIQHKHSKLDRIAEELKQLKTEAVTASAVRMTLTRQSEIERLLREQNMPLAESPIPLRVIEE